MASSLANNTATASASAVVAVVAVVAIAVSCSAGGAAIAIRHVAMDGKKGIHLFVEIILGVARTERWEIPRGTKGITAVTDAHTTLDQRWGIYAY